MTMNIEWLKEQGPCKDFAAGDAIPCPASGAQKTMYILLTGGVDVYRKSPVGGVKKSSSISPGDLFGGQEYFLGNADCSYKAREDSTVYLLTKETFNEISWSQPDILFELLRCAFMPSRPAVQSAPVPLKSIAERAKEAEKAKAAAKAEAAAKAAAEAKAKAEAEAAEKFRQEARARVLAQAAELAKAAGKEPPTGVPGENK